MTIAPHVEDKTKDDLTFPEACKRLEEAGADVVGLNCCRGPSTMLPLLKEIKKVCKVSMYYMYYISVLYLYFSSISILLLLHAYRFINFNFNIWILCYKVWKENLRNCMMLWFALRYALFKVLRINSQFETSKMLWNCIIYMCLGYYKWIKGKKQIKILMYILSFFYCEHHPLQGPIAALPVPFRTTSEEPTMEVLTDPDTGRSSVITSNCNISLKIDRSIWIIL